QAWDALVEANDPPVVFRRGGMPMRLEAGDAGELVLRQLTLDRTRHELAEAAYWYAVTKTGRVLVQPPMAVVHNLLATPNQPLPVLLRIVEVPVFAADGALELTPGYNSRTRVYYEPPAQVVVTTVPEKPTAEQVTAARELIVNDLLGEFPFVSDADKAHAVAVLVAPFVRDLIDGPTPGHMIEAPSPGSGRGLRTDV